MSQTDQFEATFGQLYIGKHPTNDRNSLMVLHFDFSSISTFDSVQTARRELDKCIKDTLRVFLSQYSGYFDESDMNGLLEDDGVNALQRLFHFVEASGHKLFVAVDEYDTPANTCLFSDDPGLRDQFPSIAKIFQTRFFAVMKRACSTVVQKYWITDVLPVFRDALSPLRDAIDVISSAPQLNGLCGLTQEEVSSIAKAYLHTFPPQRLDLVLEELKRWYGGYKFSYRSSSTLYYPQGVFNYLRKLGITDDLTRSHDDDDSILHSENILKGISNGGVLSFDDQALSETQQVQTFGINEVKQIDRNAMCTLVYCLGVLTKGDDKSSSHIRFPNQSMVDLVQRRFPQSGE